MDALPTGYSITSSTHVGPDDTDITTLLFNVKKVVADTTHDGTNGINWTIEGTK
jgi:hypothetical protein